MPTDTGTFNGDFDDLGAILETVSDRDYEIDTVSFFHLKLKEPSDLIENGSWVNDANGTYSTFFSRITTALSFEHQIVHQKVSGDDVVIQFFLHDFTKDRRMPCSPHNHSVTTTANTARQKHVFNVVKNHHYGIGVKIVSPSNTIVRIMKGSTLSVTPVLGSDSGFTDITTTRFMESEMRQVGQFVVPAGNYSFENPFIIDMTDTSNQYITKAFNSLPGGQYHLKLHISGINASFPPLPPRAGQDLVVDVRRTCPPIGIIACFILLTVQGQTDVMSGPINLNFNTRFESPPLPCVCVTITIPMTSMPGITLNDDIIGTFFATPITDISDTLLTAGNHLSLNTGTVVDNPDSPFILDYRGVTKPKNIQLIKYNGSYSSFVPNVDMELSITLFFEVTSNVSKTISFSVSRNNSLSNPDIIPESTLEIVLIPDGQTRRFEKSFILKVKKGEEFFVFCPDTGDFDIGTTTMLHIVEHSV